MKDRGLSLSFRRILLLMRLSLKNDHDKEILPPSQYRALEYIISNPGCTQNDVALAIHVTAAAIAQNMKKLCMDGYVERIPCPNNLRANSLRVTETGVKCAEYSLKAVMETEERLLQGFTDEEKETIKGYVDRMIANFENPATDSLEVPELMMLVMNNDGKAKSEGTDEE